MSPLLNHRVSSTLGRLRSNDAGLTSGVDIGLRGLAVITGPLLARGLGPAGRGDMAALSAPVALLAYLTSFGIPYASLILVRRYNRSALLGTGSAISFAIGLPVLTAAGIAADGYLGPGRHQLLVLAWLFLLVTLIGVPSNIVLFLVQARRPGPLWNAIRSIPAVANVLGLTSLALSGNLTVVTALAVQLVSSFLVVPTTAIIGLRWGPPRFDRGLVVAQTTLGAKFAISSVADLIILAVDQSVLAGTVSSSELGYYAIAVSYTSLSGFVNTGKWLVGINTFRDSEPDADMTRRFMRSSVINQAVAAIALAILAVPVIYALFGKQFLAAVPYALVLLVAGVIASYASALAVIASTSNRAGATAMSSVVGAIITVLGLIGSTAVGEGALGAGVVTVGAHIGRAGYLKMKLI